MELWQWAVCGVVWSVLGTVAAYSVYRFLGAVCTALRTADEYHEFCKWVGEKSDLQ